VIRVQDSEFSSWRSSPSCSPGSATVLFPASALWTSGLLCRSPYHLTHGSSYSYGRGTSVSFQCVSGASSYDVNFFAIFGLQILLAVLVVSVGALMWRLLRKPR
jgi:hypothetical protein